MPGSNIYTGTLELLILRILRGEARHGYAIGRRLSEQTDGLYDLEEGVLYPALHRLNNKGWVKGAWGGDGIRPKGPFLQPGPERPEGPGAGDGPLAGAHGGGGGRVASPLKPS